MIREFQGKVAVVTGAGSGIGKGLARAFAKRGMKLVITDIDQESLSVVEKELTTGGTETLSVVGDVSKYEDVSKLADMAFDKFGKVNVLCNNAGVGGSGRQQKLEMADWHHVLGIDLFGVIHGIKSFLPRMLASGEDCHIVNTASLAGHLASATNAPYAAAKFGVVAISEALKRECFASKVGVSVLCPGFVNTGIMKNTAKAREGVEGLFQAPPEVTKQIEATIKHFEKQIAEGMSPDVLAEKVIIAIEEDILYIMTHPEHQPIITSRLESIQHDTNRLDQKFKELTGIEESNDSGVVETLTYQFESPAFKFHYPKTYQKTPPPFPGFNPEYYATSVPGSDLTVQVQEKDNPMLPPDYSLETANGVLLGTLGLLGREGKILSDEEVILNDGTIARKGVLEYRTAGITKARVLTLYTLKDEKWISLIVGVIDTCFDKKYQDIIDSFEFG